MAEKPTYKELERKVKDIEKGALVAKRTEETLREALASAQDEKLKSDTIIESLGDGICIIDPDFRILYENKVHKDAFGDHIGQHCYMTFRNMDRVCEGCPAEACFKDGEIHTRERSVQTENGLSYFEVTASPLLDSSGNITAVVEIVRDITKRSQAEKALRESEERYRTLFENNLSPIFLIDAEGNYVDSNEAGLRFVECTRNELLAKNVKDFVQSGKERQVIEEHSLIWKTGGIIETEYYFNGNVKLLELSITPLLLSGKPVIFGIGKDITDHKQALEALRKSEDRYRNLVETSPHGIQEIDVDGTITFANRAHGRIHGYDPEELIGRSISDLVASDEERMTNWYRNSLNLHQMSARMLPRMEGLSMCRSTGTTNVMTMGL
jgi:PAS domain S-box-containing protein